MGIVCLGTLGACEAEGEDVEPTVMLQPTVVKGVNRDLDIEFGVSEDNNTNDGKPMKYQLVFTNNTAGTAKPKTVKLSEYKFQASVYHYETRDPYNKIQLSYRHGGETKMTLEKGKNIPLSKLVGKKELEPGKRVEVELLTDHKGLGLPLGTVEVVVYDPDQNPKPFERPWKCDEPIKANNENVAIRLDTSGITVGGNMAEKGCYGYITVPFIVENLTDQLQSIENMQLETRLILGSVGDSSCRYIDATFRKYPFEFKKDKQATFILLPNATQVCSIKYIINTKKIKKPVYLSRYTDLFVEWFVRLPNNEIGWDQKASKDLAEPTIQYFNGEKVPVITTKQVLGKNKENVPGIKRAGDFASRRMRRASGFGQRRGKGHRTYFNFGTGGSSNKGKNY
ncbi:MAG: hypothetical protein AAFP88_01360 [Bacteroidota bacterium]